MRQIKIECVEGHTRYHWTVSFSHGCGDTVIGTGEAPTWCEGMLMAFTRAHEHGSTWDANQLRVEGPK